MSSAFTAQIVFAEITCLRPELTRNDYCAAPDCDVGVCCSSELDSSILNPSHFYLIEMLTKAKVEMCWCACLSIGHG